MERALQWTRFHIPISEYTGSPDRRELAALTHDGPEWLNNYFVVNALEALCKKRLAVKCTEYDPMRLPFYQMRYTFLSSKTEPSVMDTASKLEAGSKCLAYQVGSRCPLDFRFERQYCVKTVSYNTVNRSTSYKLNQSSPPCEQCWEREDERPKIALLVVNLIENELREELTLLSMNDIPDEAAQWRFDGTVGPFLASVVYQCIEDGLGAEKEDIDAVLQTARRVLSYRSGPIGA